MGICDSSQNKSNNSYQPNQPNKIKPINKQHQTNNGHTRKERGSIKYFAQNNNTEYQIQVLILNKFIKR